jgi:hypothetical protein
VNVGTTLVTLRWDVPARRGTGWIGPMPAEGRGGAEPS